TLVPQQQNYAKISNYIKNTAHYQDAVNQIKDNYELDTSLCEACQETENCPETSSFIEEAMVEIALLDCENLLNNIKEEIYKAKGRDFIITDSVLALNPKYCQYEFCLKNQQSDVFEKQLSRISNWDAAVSGGYNNALSIDPFFSGTLSGAASTNAMLTKLNNIFVANIQYDSNLDGNLDMTRPISGSILQLTDPFNTSFYFDDNGHQSEIGKHILYWNIFSNINDYTYLEFLQELNIQRWLLYKSLYLEEKRKLKMELAEAHSCPALLAELRRTDELPYDKSEEEIIAWGRENYLYDSVSDEQLKMTISNIESACGIKLDATETATVKDELKNYFNSNDKNYFRFILKEDFGINPNLILIENTLNMKGCSLDSIAVFDPLICNNLLSVSNERYVEIPLDEEEELYGTTSLNLNSEDRNQYNNNVYKEREKKYLKESLDRSKKDADNKLNKLIEEKDKKIKQDNTEIRLNSINFLTLNNVVTEEEKLKQYKALMALYIATDGPNWFNNDGWRDADPNVMEPIGSWYGLHNQSLGTIAVLSIVENGLNGKIPKEIGDLTTLLHLNLSKNNLNDSIPIEIGHLTNLQDIFLYDSNIIGNIPSEINNLEELRILNLINNNLTGVIPDLGNLSKLKLLDLSSNYLKFPLFMNYTGLLNLERILLSSNNISQNIPSEISRIPNLQTLDLKFNGLKGKISDSLQSIPELNVLLNEYTFGDILPFISIFSGDNFAYSIQNQVDRAFTYNLQQYQPVKLIANVDRNTAIPSKYQWFKYWNGINDIPLTPEPTYDGHTFTFSSISNYDEGDYYYIIVNEGAPELTLRSSKRRIKVQEPQVFTICLGYDQTNPTLADFNFKVNWSDEIARCLSNQQVKDSILVEHALEKYIQKQVRSTYKSVSSNCLKNISESFQYKYVSREYHYTLYYYDQAKNLVQTVPPKGVHPLAPGSSGEPQHTLTTRYRYNSLNQLVWQNTPDGGKSEFWYNNLGQLRISRNAKQEANDHYSYSKYDALGRIVEVGEMKSAETPVSLFVNLENPIFPLSDNYPLHDITRTHYDRSLPNLGGAFAQTNLRNRVSWVEVIDNMESDTVATFYTYDIHGNVKSLLQKIPGLANKRTDYLYDLVSGNVNYVMYQYGEDDQFVHRYEYDEDNRIREVYTSTDRYVWDKEAEYAYYQHGPLARVELGHYNVQNLDYTYTLQGWIKGVNMPYEGDPGKNGLPPSKVPKDAFAYTLGYYKNDYKAIGSGIAHYDTRDKLWARLDENLGNENTNKIHEGLYNGNISWMVTDLPSIGQAANDRTKGMQAMLYKYDQLNRITKARSLTNYTPGSGFNARSTNPAAYDVDYSYDPNGNLLTLLRRDQNGGILSDYNYEYYNYTNRLKKVEGVIPDDNLLDERTYNESPLVPYGKYYERIYVEGPANVPTGHTATLQASNFILLQDGFIAAEGGTFTASIIDPQSIPDPEVPDANYIYDEIGNLIADRNEGIEKITWTAYGKIRRIEKKNGSTISFRYDASGNRIQKWMGDIGGYTIIQYVRDAGGNVMAIYEKEELIEQPIYGSARLGMYRGGKQEGHRTLGSKNYELSNHLGNVLAVVTDNIHMAADSVWTDVVSVSDYYPFGLNMPGRSWTDEDLRSYRYGFNGKEKDPEGMGGGGSTYDYGFRIYNPQIARFLSVDPLFQSYPWYTPYQFAGNNPIWAIDLDGLEEKKVNDKSGEKRVEEAKEHENKYTYSQENVRPLNMDNRKCFDCSGFVLNVMQTTDPETAKKLADPKNPNEGNTKTIQDGIK
ncbi:MAG: hypothetical protein M3512_12365, partial [Bacteroidota bacterium]|nr:hypothetical protein [Bacteroidota bacterium]